MPLLPSWSSCPPPLGVFLGCFSATPALHSPSLAELLPAFQFPNHLLERFFLPLLLPDSFVLVQGLSPPSSSFLNSPEQFPSCSPQRWVMKKTLPWELDPCLVAAWHYPLPAPAPHYSPVPAPRAAGRGQKIIFFAARAQQTQPRGSGERALPKFEPPRAR